MKKNSFTLLEVILAITVLTLAAAGSFILISQTIGSVAQLQSRLIASYLIQEGLEITRNIRDSNWLKNQAFDQNLGAGDWEGDYLTFTPCLAPCQYDELRFLGIDGNGFYGYNYSPGKETIFKRKISISDKVDLDTPPDGKFDKFKVSVQVLWKERDKIHSLTAQEYLYNWNK